MTTETASKRSNLYTTLTIEELRSAGLTPREIHRLSVLRSCVDCYPHLEFFGNDEWKQLQFLKWRIDHGRYSR